MLWSRVRLTAVVGCAEKSNQIQFERFPACEQGSQPVGCLNMQRTGRGTSKNRGSASSLVSVLFETCFDFRFWFCCLLERYPTSTDLLLSNSIVVNCERFAMMTIAEDALLFIWEAGSMTWWLLGAFSKKMIPYCWLPNICSWVVLRVTVFADQI